MAHAQSHRWPLRPSAAHVRDSLLRIADRRAPAQSAAGALATTGRRRLRQAAAPGVTLALNVTTRSADVLQQRARLQAAAGAPYVLASHIGSQGARLVIAARASWRSQGRRGAL